MLALPFPEDAFDVVLCQLGLQFFPDRPLALREMRRVLSRGGRLALNVFGAIEHNPATQALANALDRRLGSGASLAKRTEHALADAVELRGLLTVAGFQRVVISTVRKTVKFPSVSDYVQIQLAATPLANLASRSDGRRSGRLLEVLTEDIAKVLAISPCDEPFTFPQEVHVALATS